MPGGYREGARRLTEPSEVTRFVTSQTGSETYISHMNTLGIDKAPSETRVVVAMSGGVDSSATAALLASEGYDVIGATLQLYDHGQAVTKPGSCCAGQDIHDARRVAAALRIPHYVLDYEDRFRTSVIDDFAESYLRGETPIPCVRCNETVKFGDLLRTARELGADALATGHYVRRRMGPNGAELLRAADESRDQSYFLFATTRRQLEFLRFPLGDLAKERVRELARRFHLSVAAKPDSQDICFVPEGDYAGVVEKLRPEARRPGDIVDLEGRVLGRHQGIVHFTIGQRRRLGVSAPRPLYVVRLEPAAARVVVGPRRALLGNHVNLRGVNWLGPGEPPARRLRVSVKLRSAMAAVPAIVACAGTSAEVMLDEPFAAAAAGQACVFYDGEILLGGGWIMREEAETKAAK